MCPLENANEKESCKSPEGQIFIEIKHPFGTPKEATYSVYECSEKEISFLVPVNHGYFLPGTPIEYSIIGDDENHIQRRGIVRRYQHFVDKKNVSFYKIDVETTRDIDKKGFHKLRPQRFSLEDWNIEQRVHVIHQNEQFDLKISDVSKYSMAFLCPNDLAGNFMVGAVIDSLHLSFQKITVYSGPGTIIRIQKKGFDYLVVVKPNKGIIEVEKGINFHHVDGEFKECKNHIRDLMDISPAYKILISDAVSVLNTFDQLFSTSHFKKLTREMNELELLSKIETEFYPIFDRCFTEMADIVLDKVSSDEANSKYKNYFQLHLHPRMIEGNFTGRMYAKPLGYPGDYEMMRIIKDVDYGGRKLIDKLIDMHALHTPLAQANRERIDYLSNAIIDAVDRSGEKRFNILSIASGASFEISEVIQRRPDIADKITVTCIDQELKALQYAQESIYRQCTGNELKLNISFVQMDIASLIRKLKRNQLELSGFNLIYVFGLFDYFEDKMCVFFIRQLFEMLAADGVFIASNYSLDGHQHRIYLEFAFEWYMVYRTCEKLNEIGENSCSSNVEIKIDESHDRVIKYLLLQKA
jgi:extracellular factor (EF) 3-hydroxypalmitic acid methyl ester biosynthesis protein